MQCGVYPLDNGRLSAEAEKKMVTVSCMAVLKLKLWWVMCQVLCPWWEHHVLLLVERNASPIIKSQDDYSRKVICVSNGRSWEFWLVLGWKSEGNEISLPCCELAVVILSMVSYKGPPLVLDLLRHRIPQLPGLLFPCTLMIDRTCGMIRGVHHSVIKVFFCPLLTSVT